MIKISCVLFLAIVMVALNSNQVEAIQCFRNHPMYLEMAKTRGWLRDCLYPNEVCSIIEYKFDSDPAPLYERGCVDKSVCDQGRSNLKCCFTDACNTL